MPSSAPPLLLPHSGAARGTIADKASEVSLLSYCTWQGDKALLSPGCLRSYSDQDAQMPLVNGGLSAFIGTR